MASWEPRAGPLCTCRWLQFHLERRRLKATLAPEDTQRDFPVDLYKVVFSRQDMTQLFRRKRILNAVLVLALWGIKHEPSWVIITSRESRTENRARKRRILWFMSTLPLAVTKSHKRTHLAVCIIPDSVVHWNFGIFKPFKGISSFLKFFTFLLCFAPWHTCSQLTILPARLGPIK